MWLLLKLGMLLPKIGNAITGAINFVLAHPLQCAAFAFAALFLIDQHRIGLLKSDYAAVCAELHTTGGKLCLQEAHNAIVSRDAYKTALDRQTENVTVARAANVELQAAIDNVTAVNAANLKMKADAQARADAALTALNKARDQIARITAARQKLEDQLYANDATCKAWGDQPVCPGVDSWLRANAPRPAAAGGGDSHGQPDGDGQGIALLAAAAAGDSAGVCTGVP